MVYNDWNVVYRVKFPKEARHLNDDFDTKEEAIEYAKEHINRKPVVCGLEIFVDDDGNQISEGESEVIFQVEEEKSEAPVLTQDELAIKLKNLEGAPLDDEIKEVTVDTAEDNAKIADVDQKDPLIILKALYDRSPEDLTAEAKQKLVDAGIIKISEEPKTDIETSTIFGGNKLELPVTEYTDPFATDFSDISKDEEEYTSYIDHQEDFSDFIVDLAKQLGIDEDGVITQVDINEIPEVSPIEVVTDNSLDFPAPSKDVDEEHVTDLTLGDDLVKDNDEQQEPVIDQISEPAKTEVVVKAKIPDDAVNKIQGKEVQIQIPVDPSIDVEAKKETCPVCGEEKCICESKVTNEGTELERHQKIADNFRKKFIKEPELVNEALDDIDVYNIVSIEKPGDIDLDFLDYENAEANVLVWDIKEHTKDYSEAKNIVSFIFKADIDSSAFNFEWEDCSDDFGNDYNVESVDSSDGVVVEFDHFEEPWSKNPKEYTEDEVCKILGITKDQLNKVIEEAGDLARGQIINKLDDDYLHDSSLWPEQDNDTFNEDRYDESLANDITDQELAQKLESVRQERLTKLEEDTVKQDGKWVNKGEAGTHGEFETKKAADEQRKAIFASGWKK